MGGDKVYVIGDLVQSNDSQMMKLVVQQVAGIDEPVSLVAAKGFAVGAKSNSLYTWTASYEEESEAETAS